MRSSCCNPFNEGDTGKGLSVIIGGKAKSVKRTTLVTSRTLINLKKGDAFGEMAPIGALPWSAKVLVKKRRSNQSARFRTACSIRLRKRSLSRPSG